MKFRQLELFGEQTTEKEASPDSESMPVPATPEVPVVLLETLPPGPAILAETPAEVDLLETKASPSLRRPRRQARQASRAHAVIELPPDEQLFTRQYYGIGEVAAMFQVKVSVLRYWESEFDMLDLRKNRKGDRFFRPDDIKTVRLIYHLLRERRFTIEGAREYIRQHSRGRERVEAIETLRRIRSFLVGVRETLIHRSPPA